MTLRIGLTGNIGSGKSSAAKAFEVLGIPVFYADDESKSLLNTAEVQNEIIEIFGKEIVDNKKVDRLKLASIVFTDKEKLSQLNQILHPRVYELFIEWVNEQNSLYIILEAAILFESGFDKYVDKTINVFAKKSSRIRRVSKRDNIDRESIQDRMDNQWSDAKKKELADHNLDNNDNEMLLPQILKLHKSLLNSLQKK
ncbi:MAG: dephospho-CoA kinase [Bacteroidetes bacterium]|nr:dephospho-CoA kinase [Bacteroidota bacterium]|tara:strand:+ start:671 stop:1264 length:594 start_codon:yes stop_codon:yes gene_type:complete